MRGFTVLLAAALLLVPLEAADMSTISYEEDVCGVEGQVPRHGSCVQHPFSRSSRRFSVTSSPANQVEAFPTSKSRRDLPGVQDPRRGLPEIKVC